MKKRQPQTVGSQAPPPVPPAAFSTAPEIGAPPDPSALAARAIVLRNFERYLATTDKGKDGWSLNKAAKAARMDLAQFRAHLRVAFLSRDIQIRMPRNLDRERRLAEAWPRVKHYYVLNTAPDEEFFFRGAAEVFFDVLRGVLHGRDPAVPLRIGIVSGRTTGGMINAICNHAGPWDDLLPMKKLPKDICIYALNSSQTHGYEELQGNANVLAFFLAERVIAKIHESESIAQNDRPIVQAFGLSARLLQAKKDVQETDCSPETSCVLRHTDPVRLRASFEACGKTIPDELLPLPDQSELDMVITGAGSARDSLFCKYGAAHELNYEELVEKELVVGDIAYSPVNRMGETKQLLNKNKIPMEFYCAISLDILREMSRDPNKRVILVARNGPDNKSFKAEVIHAAIAPEKPLCNVMITDDPTAYDMLLRLSRLAG